MSKRDSQKIKNKRIMNALLIFLFAIVGIAYINNYNSECETATNAVIEGKLFTVSSKIPGMVTSIYVDIDSEVKKGDLIAELDRAYYVGKLRSAELELRDLRMKQTDDKETPSEFKGKKSPLSKFKFNHSGFFDGYSKLYGDDINQDDSDEGDIKCLSEAQTKTKQKVDSHGKIVGKAEEQTVKKSDTDEKESEEDIDAKIKRLEAEIEQGKLNLSYTKIHAPQDGTISVISVDQGEYIYAGQTVLSIIPKRVWVSANFTQEQADKMEVGQPVIVKIKKYPLRNFKGMVDNIMPPEQNGRMKYVPVRILFIEDYSEFDLQPGTPVKATVQVNKRILK